MSFEKALLRASLQPQGRYARTILVCCPDIFNRNDAVSRDTAASISTVLKKVGGETFHHRVGFDKANSWYLLETILPTNAPQPPLERTVNTLDEAVFAAEGIPLLEVSQARQTSRGLLRDYMAGHALLAMMEDPTTDVTEEAKAAYAQHHDRLLDIAANEFLISLR